MGGTGPNITSVQSTVVFRSDEITQRTGGNLKLNGSGTGASYNDLVITNTGKVGIGTATPTSNLEVASFVDGTSTELKIRSGSTNAHTGASNLALRAGDGSLGFDLQYNAGAAAFKLNNVLNGGALGTPFQVTQSNGASMFSNTTNSLSGFNVTNAAFTSVFKVDTTNSRVSINGSTNAYTFNVNGDVAIGNVATPGVAKLYVQGESGSNAAYIVGGVAAGGSYGLTILAGTNNADFGLRIQNPQTVNTTLAVRGDGNIGVGTEAPNDKLDVRGDIRVGVSGTDGCLKNFSGGTIVGSCTSDARLKKNIVSNESVLSRFGDIRIVNYNWRSDEFPELHFGDSVQTGVIAQEVELLFPDLVNIDHDGFKRVDYTKLGLYNIQATTELNTKVNGIDQRLAASETMLGSGSGDFIRTNSNATVNNLSVAEAVSAETLTVTGTASVGSLSVSGVATVSELTVTSSATIASLTVTGNTSVQNLYVGGKLISKGPVPTLNNGAALNGVAGVNTSVAGTDRAGTVTITVGAAAPATGELTQVVFDSAYTTPPKVVISGNNKKSAKLGAYITRTTTGFTIVTDDPLEPGSTYSFDYIVIGAEN